MTFVKMTFIEELKNQTNFSETENGFKGYKTTFNELLDFNFKVPYLRRASDEELVLAINNLLRHIPDKVTLYRYIFYLRDARGGMGERRIFRNFLRALAYEAVDDLESLFDLIVEYGRWDDLFAFMETNYEERMTKFVIKKLQEDRKAALEGKPITLLAKWMPSENASSKETKNLAIYFRKEMGLSSRSYRKLLSKLRDYSNVVEHRISKGEYAKIDYASVPSRANLRYADLFLAKDCERRIDFLESLKKGETGVKAAVLYPSDVVSYLRERFPEQRYAFSPIRRPSEDVKAIVDGLWKGLPDYGEIQNALVVVDVSGSMACPVGGKVEAIDVSMGLGAYFAEHNKAPFDNKVVTFSSNPVYRELVKGDIIHNVNTMLDSEWGMNTNVKAVFDLVLNTALASNCKQEDLPNIVIISDMEFDGCGGKKYKHDFDKIKKTYKKHGYKLPRLIFWNVNSRTNTIPMRESENGVLLLSGFSPSSIKAVMSGELDPYKALLACINVPRYDKVEEVVKNF